MVTIDEIKKADQLDHERLSELAKDSPYPGYVLRKISPYFAKFFIEHNISANQTSFLSILFGIIANVTFVFGSYYSILLGCFFYQFWNIFDLVDGEIARVANVKTVGGKYLETINDAITESAFIACLGVGLSKILGNDMFVLFGLVFALFICLLNYFARTRDVIIEQFELTNTKINPAKMSYVRRLYKKARLFFIIYNGYLILTVIVISELILPFRVNLSILGEKFIRVFGENLSLTAIYFLLYGSVWTIRALVSSITNYRRLMRG